MQIRLQSLGQRPQECWPEAQIPCNLCTLLPVLFNCKSDNFFTLDGGPQAAAFNETHKTDNHHE